MFFAFVTTVTVHGTFIASADTGSDPALDLFNDLQDFINLHIEECVEKYERLPSSATNLFENEEFLITIKLDNGDLLRIKAVKEDTKLVEFRQLTEDEDFDPTIKVATDEGTVRDIIESDTDWQAFNEGIKALDDETVKIDFPTKDWLKYMVFWTVENSISFAIQHDLSEYAIIEHALSLLFYPKFDSCHSFLMRISSLLH